MKKVTFSNEVNIRYIDKNKVVSDSDSDKNDIINLIKNNVKKIIMYFILLILIIYIMS